MANLEELTEKIKTRLSEQNQILKDCVQKYQNSQKERKDIAGQIQNITTQLTQATNNLETIQKNHIEFRNARAKKLQEYEDAQQKMQSDFALEKKGLEEQKSKAAEDARQREEKLRSDLEGEAKKHEQEQLRKQKEAADKSASVKEEQHQSALKEQERKVEESKGKLQEFADKLKNTQEEAKRQQEALIAEQKKEIETAATNNEKKLELLTNQVNDLTGQIQNLTTTHNSNIEELKNTSQAELDKLKQEQQSALETQKRQLEEIHQTALKEQEDLNASSLQQLIQQQELKTKASNDTARSETEKLKTDLQQCEEKFNKSEELYEANKQELNKIQEEFKTAETTAANALKESVENLAKENEKLQAKIRDLMGEDKTDAQVANMPGIPSMGAKTLDELSPARKDVVMTMAAEMVNIIKGQDGDWWKFEFELTKAPDTKEKKIELLLKREETLTQINPDEKKIVKEMIQKDLQQGGYKHGKRSNKRNKRSLKSKLTARKFSLKKRSKRKKKGKSKKRRKSIKIRI